ncbi:MAG TPA: neocarzinostatin apoprotein domain-containing protein [Acidimicrobiia bacterium]|nr:neocarzinostatin apoprotein domain-containing protein [Acidimicrobiia bacterium]
MRSTKTVIRLVCVLAVLGLAVGACSSSSSGSSKKAKASTSTTKKAKAEPKITITPSTGLANNQTVHVTATGFSPNQKNLGINECADKGDATGADDCNIAGTKVLVSDAKGNITADFVVLKGPFGGNNIVCSAQQKCLLSVSQLVQSPTEEADAQITFAG